MAHIIDILIIAISSALLSGFFISCLEPGQIFERYGRWLRNTVHVDSKIKRIAYPIRNPLGLCIHCNSTWIFIFKFVILFIIIHDICLPRLIIYFLIGLGYTHLSVKLYNKL